MKHWTEPNGIFLIHIPIEWQYLNPAVKGEVEKSPYSFQPYDDVVGCFQISCYPLNDLAPKTSEANPIGVPILNWQLSRMDDSEYCCYLFYGALADQALIGKYIYDVGLKSDKRIIEQLSIVAEVLNSIVIVPVQDRKLASSFDKLDKFVAALGASYDLLDSALESESFIEFISISANQLDAYLRLSIVLAIQLENHTNDIPIEYLFQADNEKGFMERKIFGDSLKYGVINQELFSELNLLYQSRNRVIHRYIISNIKSRDLIEIASQYNKIVEKVRLILRDLEEKQAKEEFGIYGRKYGKTASISDNNALKRAYADVNDKHLLEKFKRKIII